MSHQGCATFVSDCHVRAATELVQHQWDPVVLSALRAGPVRRNALLDDIADISDKVLTQALQRLTQRGLVTRSAPAGATSAGAVYALTALGASFANGPLMHLAEWAADHQTELAEPPATARSAQALSAIA